MSEHPKTMMQNPTEMQETLRRRNAMWIAIITGVVMALVTVITLPVVFQIGMERIWGLIITATTAMVAFFSAFISSRNRPTLGSGILIAVILTLSFVVTFVFANNQGIAIAAIVVFLVSTVASMTMPQAWVPRLIIISIVVGALNILADLYLPNLGFPSDPRYTNIVAAVISTVYLVIILRRFSAYSLRTKLALSFVLITLTPIILVGIQNNIIATRNFRQQAEAGLVLTARTSAQAIDTVLNSELDSIRTEAQIIDLVDYLTLPPDRRKGSQQEERALGVLRALQGRNTDFISSYALLDADGINILDTDQADTGINESERDYFREVRTTGRPYISSIQFSRATSGYSIHFSAPVRTSDGAIVGVLRSRHDVSLLQDILEKTAITNNNEEFAVLVDNETLLRLAHTKNRDLLFKTYQSLTAEQTFELQKKLGLPIVALQGISVPQFEIVQGMNDLGSKPVFTSPSQEYGGEASYLGGFRLQNANWTVLVSRTERSILSPIQDQTRAIIVTSMVLLMAAGLAGVLVAQLLARPIVQLAGIAARIASGDLNIQADIKTKDEIGALSNSFNRMTRQLQDTLVGLERRIADRTTDLNTARMLSERRALELQSISEISRAISTEQRLDVLLPLITRLVSERFGFYHVGIFFVDDIRRFVHLQAANSEGGERMLERGHRLEIGVGLVGTAVKTSKPRIALDVGADAAFFDNPDLPETRSEMALPLNVRGQTIGVLDVQSTKQGAFSERDANTLGILADQVAIAIENARLFSQMQQAREEAEALYAQIRRREWNAFSQQEARIGYRQTASGGRRLVKPVENDEIREAVNKGQVVVLDGKDNKTQPAIAVPVKLRGQVIGVLNIKAPTRERKWNQDEISLAQAISDRLALALDNARLLQESQSQAAKEAKIGEVSAKISASINMSNVLQTAVEELGRALPGSEVVIQFQSGS